mgnify:CR=1 FL=1
MEKDSIPNAYYVNGIGICKEFAFAFSKGCGGRIYETANILHNGDVSMFGDPATWQLLQKAKQDNRTLFYGDKAYFGRSKYYRITKNAYQSDCIGNGDTSRLNKTGQKIYPWKTGSKILICQQSELFYKLHGLNRDDWVSHTKRTIRQYTDRPIEIRSKISGDGTEFAFRRALVDVHAVVVYTSVAGVQAAMNGVPCFATEQCASLAFGSSDLSQIENPVLPDNREYLASVLANNQWTLDEIYNGTAWRMLNENME